MTPPSPSSCRGWSIGVHVWGSDPLPLGMILVPISGTLSCSRGKDKFEAPVLAESSSRFPGTAGGLLFQRHTRTLRKSLHWKQLLETCSRCWWGWGQPFLELWSYPSWPKQGLMSSPAACRGHLSGRMCPPFTVTTYVLLLLPVFSILMVSVSSPGIVLLQGALSLSALASTDASWKVRITQSHKLQAPERGVGEVKPRKRERAKKDYQGWDL